MLFGEKGEFEADRARLARGLPVAGDCEESSAGLLKLVRGVDRW